MQQHSGIPDRSPDDDVAKLRLLTYSRIELERCGVDPAILEKNCPLDYFSNRIGSVQPKLHTALGALQTLPLELLHLILHDLDLHTLTIFRSVNKQARHLVSSLPRYHAIVQHVPNTLRFVLSTHAAATCTLSQLYQALLSSDCFICGSRRAAQNHFKLDKSSTNALPVALSLPGRYGLQRNLSRKRNWIVLRASAHQAAIVLYGSEKKLASRLSCATSSPPTAPNLNSGCVDGYAVGAISLLRFQTVIRFPTLDASTGALEWGIACQACRDEHDCKGPWQDRYKLYSNRQYLQHFQQCDAAQQKWQEYLQSKGEVQEFYWPGTTKRSGSRILSSPR
ncbi:MAG: hypothetical protein Q9188_003369 [Gyalolechia gomerana]